MRRAQYLMGTVIEISVEFEPDASEIRDNDEVFAAAFSQFERIATMCNRFDPESELSSVNEKAANTPCRVSDELFALLERGLRYTMQTDSTFSILLQPLVDLWQGAANDDVLPGKHAINAALAHCDPSHVHLCQRKQTVSFSREGSGFNLDGLAKGYAADQARGALALRGVRNATINAGASSLNFLKSDHDPPQRRLLARSPCGDHVCLSYRALQSSVSTSGTGERDFTIAGKRYSHLINPATGHPLQGSLAATALSLAGETAEVASKVLLFKGYEAGMTLCKRLGLAASGFVLRSGRKGLAFDVEGSPWLHLAEAGGNA